MNKLVIIDFETTGMSPDYNRIIEIGAMQIEDNTITSSFSQLINPKQYIPTFITQLTGISNQMVRNQPCAAEIMPKFYDFLGDSIILAHNISFDKKFLIAEMKRVNLSISNDYLCSLLLARRIFQESPNHKLGTLVRYLNIPMDNNHQEHRALDDVKVTAQLWFKIKNMVEGQTSNANYNLFKILSKMPKAKISSYLQKLS